ncbi:isoaspartyl peptidase/L-asparaginase [Halyomorpha halys]|uniref:isoaspartyl peptidase/L-asparaginase n=1 Tax=Halyomorpha halys TaxID=286706 RepID=UPI0006D4D25B|nr:isoaspartyl peptidase/L-asparaginase-like isoform X2 [Halyomorpha halys]
MIVRLIHNNPSTKLNQPGLKCLYEIIRSKSTVKPVLVVHGGAEYIPDTHKKVKLDGVKQAACQGYRVLTETGCVLDAVEAAICVLENNEVFNAGRGAVLNLDGKVEMDALINEGRTFSSGSVTLARSIAHPISLARMVMENTPHAIIGGEGVEDFITKMAVPRVPDDYLITEDSKRALEKFKKLSSSNKGPKLVEFEEPASGDTVGCVAVDMTGHVASGASTGGLTGKYRGRIGDSPIPGCGGYSDDEIGAIAVTGHGELILQYNFSHRVLSLMKQGKSAQDAATAACDHMAKRMKKTIMVGAITVSNKGEVGIFFSTKHMPWAYQVCDELHYGINQGEDICEKIG